MSTSDGGKTWRQVLDTTQDPAGLPVRWPKSFHFTDPLHGWVTGNENEAPAVRLYITTDGGKTWNRAKIEPPAPDVPYTESYGPFFRGKNYATLPVIYGSQMDNTVNFTVYRTTDGGNRWIKGPTLSSSSFTELRMPTFRTATEGWVLGTDINGKPILHRTNNGGKIWQTIHPTGLEPFTEVICSLDFVTTTTGWTINKDCSWGLHFLPDH